MTVNFSPCSPPYQAGELNDCPVYRFHIRQPSRVTVPSEPVPVPEIVVRYRRGPSGRSAVWVNELGGVTFEVDRRDAEFVKVLRRVMGTSSGRRGRTAALGGHGAVRVPHVLGAGDGWLHTRGCPAGRRSTPIGWPIRGPRRVR